MLIELRAEEVWVPRVDSDLGADEVGDELQVLKPHSKDKEKEVMKKRWVERKKDEKRAKAMREAEKAKEMGVLEESSEELEEDTMV